MIDELLDKLEKVRQTGEGQYVACCPVHGDRNPSMGIREVIGDDGYRKVLVHCFACHASAQEVTGALGLPMSVLFEKPLDRGGVGTSSSTGRGGSVWDEFDRQLMPLDRGRVETGTGRGGVNAGTGRGGVQLDRGGRSMPLDRGPLPLDRGGVRLTRKQREEVELDRLVLAGAGEAERQGKRLSYKDWQRVKLARARLETLGDE